MGGAEPQDEVCYRLALLEVYEELAEDAVDGPVGRSRLLRELGPEEIEQRQLVCGDAYAFQDDERDVMLLTMGLRPTGPETSNEPEVPSEARRTCIAPARTRISAARPEAWGMDGVDPLVPYETWTPTGAFPDPRTASSTRLAELLAEVAAREGPVAAIRASGAQSLSTLARRALNRACALAQRDGLIETTNPLRKNGQAQRVLRALGHPEVVLRGAWSAGSR